MLKKFIGLIAGLALIAAASLPAFATDLSLDGNLRLQCSTATASGGAATLANKCGVITTEALTSLTNSAYTLTLTNTVAAAADIVLWSVDNGTNTTGLPIMGLATAAANSVTITFRQATATNFNGTMKIKYLIIKP